MYEAIASAIEKPLKWDGFERCAVELLREAYYPNLRPVEGGNDAGKDGVGELGNGERFFLVSTVGKDARGNLVGNIQSHLKAGGDQRVIVFATTRAVSGQRRAALTSQLREEFDVRLHDVHDRADFIQLLYHSSKWRKDLLGVPGQARAPRATTPQQGRSWPTSRRARCSRPGGAHARDYGPYRRHGTLLTVRVIVTKAGVNSDPSDCAIGGPATRVASSRTRGQRTKQGPAPYSCMTGLKVACAFAACSES